MSWKTEFIKGDRLVVLNYRLRGAGYEPATKNYAGNIAGAYRNEVDDIVRDVAGMPNDDVNDMADRIQSFLWSW